MYKKIAILLSFSVLLLAGCTTQNKSENTISNSSEIISSTSISQPNSAPEESEILMKDFTNNEMISQIGKPKRMVDSETAQECYAEITAMGAAYLAYYKPFIAYIFVPVESEADVWATGISEGLHTQYPFQTDLIVMTIFIHAAYDDTTQTITNQDSLRQFIQTEETITYDLLCKEWDQTPSLEYVSDGTYYTDFTVENTKITVSFVQTENEFVALSIWIGDNNPSLFQNG